MHNDARAIGRWGRRRRRREEEAGGGTSTYARAHMHVMMFGARCSEHARRRRPPASRAAGVCVSSADCRPYQRLLYGVKLAQAGLSSTFRHCHYTCHPVRHHESVLQTACPGRMLGNL